MKLDRRVWTLLCVAGLTSIPACGSYFGPSRAEDVTRLEAVAGTWKGYGCAFRADEQVVLHLGANGRYRITVSEGSRSKTNSGSWVISDGGWIELNEWSGFVTRYSTPGQNPEGLLLCGRVLSCGDPDSDELLRWVEEPAVVPAEAAPKASTPPAPR